LLYTLSTAVPTSAQIATTSLRGVVKDPSGALVPGARITLVDKAKGAALSTRHLFTVDTVYELPFGRSKPVLAGAGSIANALIGGWQLSGLSRWASGLPFSVTEPGWTTNYQQSGFGVITSPVQVKKHLIAGIPQVFAGNSANNINSGVYNGSPIQLPYPGEAGQRNVFRGDGYFDVDSALAKSWALPEEMKLKFAAEVYNVGNEVRFDDSPNNLNASLTSGTLGAYGGMLSTYRRMQFGLRLDF
jgi:hypothetical protein